MPRAIRSPDTGWRLAAMNARTAPNIFVREGDGISTLVVEGDWTAISIAGLSGHVLSPSNLSFSSDFGNLGRIDSAGALAILTLAPNAAFTADLPANLADLFALVGSAMADRDVPSIKTPPFHVRLGQKVYRAVQEIGASARFLGQLEVALMKSLAHPKRMRLIALASSIQKAGFDALPLIAIMTFFIGAVVALIGSDLLKTLGASELVVELVGISVLREFGVLIPAILLAGRSASTFAAQIGAMRMNQETQAMKVMGIDLFDALVVPRVLALLVIMPLLAIVAMLAGLAGGLVVSWGILDVSPTYFAERLSAAVDIRHFWVGMAKVPVLAIVIALAGCRHGLSVRGDVEDLGGRVTVAVVQALFAIILLDAAFAILFNVLEI
ncbi:phospholipid/cholesterol/gamma-HCH transport system permease protein [Sphingopyxis italica]|uniref:Phospholipid/cholesterol/gamma-HCH transport system permease protein n=2 Tax=Sphingopyxis TaxID=165697 RepID=A0A7X5XNU3_9SPHN|nr:MULTISPECIES: ABC transporter permease [Sphingopyxis]MBN8842788.1 ABC transporter permease [Sphingomonadales bacterium]NJB88524.1 phospholipid/cholesterol/gamma-HCH transport system permease protein [Sphingopyxis italica]